MSGRTGFWRMSWTSRGCVTLWCRLLVTVQPLRLVVLVFEECLELCGGVLLFNVGCLLLCNCYDWSYWFSTLLVVHAFCTASCCGFLLRLYRRKFSIFYFMVISLPMFWTCSCVVSWVVQNETAKTWWTSVPGKPLQVYCLFSAALTWERVWRPWALDGGSGAITCPAALCTVALCSFVLFTLMYGVLPGSRSGFWSPDNLFRLPWRIWR